jgi:acetyl-CoA carboxylase biotin carboxylase subunit
MKQIKKILVANRGEIAVRIIRAIREMNLQSIAVYSDADRDSLAVRLADEALCIGPAPARDSYLKIKNILQAAREAGADAIHPGYGFLSENAKFAEEVRRNNFVYIGPPTEAIRTMGCKLMSRALMERAGIPVVPGAMAAIKNREDMFATARHIGYPILLKASGGGGGRGMRKVHSEHELAQAYDLARAESFSSFGTNTIYMEKFIANPHHIEVQILADLVGNTVSLGERECSVQRRYQKLLEETPSPFLDDATRARLSKIAIMAAKTVHYTNAGTVEFIVDENRNCYFLEMNTRLQVEHAITEMVTGVDIVKEQIRIARGEPLGFTQDHVQPKGAAIECRIYAEDPDNNFMP